MNAMNGLMQVVKEIAPALGGHPVAVWDTAKKGAQQVADVFPEGMGLDQVKVLIRKHPILATCAVLAVGGLLSARGLVGHEKT